MSNSRAKGLKGTISPSFRVSFWPLYWLQCGGVLLRLVEAVPDKQEVREFYSRWGHWVFSDRTNALESTPRISPEVKVDRCVGLTTLPPLRADCLEILKTSTSWDPQGLSRTLQRLIYLYIEWFTNSLQFNLHESMMHRSWWGNRWERDRWGDIGVDGWIILGWICRRWVVGMGTGLG